jgi:hypothetical protein
MAAAGDDHRHAPGDGAHPRESLARRLHDGLPRHVHVDRLLLGSACHGLGGERLVGRLVWHERRRDQVQTFATKPGTYQLKVTPGGDEARWSMQVQDDY